MRDFFLKHFVFCYSLRVCLISPYKWDDSILRLGKIKNICTHEENTHSIVCSNNLQAKNQQLNIITFLLISLMWYVYLFLSQKELSPTKLNQYLDSPLPWGKVFIQKAVIIKIIILFTLSEAMYLVLIVRYKCLISLNKYRKSKGSLIRQFA